MKGRKIMRIVVHEVVNDPRHIDEEGQKLHDLISPALARGEEVELDFEGTQFIDVPLLRTAIGQLLKDHSRERVKMLLQVHNLSEHYRNVVESVIEYSSRYYTEPRYREAVDRFHANLFEEQ
jgi:hypothetical protein